MNAHDNRAYMGYGVRVGGVGRVGRGGGGGGGGGINLNKKN